MPKNFKKDPVAFDCTGLDFLKSVGHFKRISTVSQAFLNEQWYKV